MCDLVLCRYFPLLMMSKALEEKGGRRDVAAPFLCLCPLLLQLTAVVAWFLFHSYSLVKHLLCCLLEFTAAVHVADILGGCSTGTVGCAILGR